tara:strand:+ start:290 stop:745 length:456 start_codon:yes stop_codon:yes gene_type:complete
MTTETISTSAKPAHTVYESAIDRWVVVLLLLPPIAGVVLGGYLFSVGRSDDAAILFATAAATLLVSIACTLPCRYTLLDDAISIRCGIIIFYQVSYAEIQSVERSATLRSGPALSMKRVLLKTTKRSIVASPKDSDQFIQDIQSRINRLPA